MQSDRVIGLLFNPVLKMRNRAMEIKKLLFATKFDELRFDALQSLLDLRKAALDHVVLSDVIERER